MKVDVEGGGDSKLSMEMVVERGGDRKWRFSSRGGGF